VSSASDERSGQLLERRTLAPDGRRCDSCGVPLYACESIDANHAPVTARSGKVYYARVDRCALCITLGRVPGSRHAGKVVG
jgi:MinD superfamily P-loop ATPase